MQGQPGLRGKKGKAAKEASTAKQLSGLCQKAIQVSGRVYKAHVSFRTHYKNVDFACVFVIPNSGMNIVHALFSCSQGFVAEHGFLSWEGRLSMPRTHVNERTSLCVLVLSLSKV